MVNLGIFLSLFLYGMWYVLDDIGVEFGTTFQHLFQAIMLLFVTQSTKGTPTNLRRRGTLVSDVQVQTVQTEAQDRSLRPKICLEFGKFPVGYYRCTYLTGPKRPFRYWPFFQGSYIPDPAVASYYEDNYNLHTPPTPPSQYKDSSEEKERTIIEVNWLISSLS